MSDIFISYSAKDSQLGNWVGKGCSNFGLSYFLAEISLTGGKRWKQEILENLKASKYFFFLATNNSIQSDACKHEIGAALVTNKTLVPILNGIGFNDLPDWIKEFQGIRVENGRIDDFQKLLSNIKKEKSDDNTGLWLALGAIAMGIMLFSGKK